MPRSTLIDREQELAMASNLLLREDIALITLTGPGGTGKSRLALQIGIEMLAHFLDGVYLVRLELISDPELVIATIAKVLGFRESTGSRPIDEMLTEYLRDKQALILLDNFEQVVEAAPNIAELLEACPGVKLVITSRVPLRLRAEKELPVPPLAVPPPEKFTDLPALSQYPAVELFTQRAQAVRPDFTVTKDNLATVAEICYRLDGLPLAIELAAARINLFNSHELLSRLGRRFDLLRGGNRDLPERQRTLRGAIDWSYNLLDEPQKKLFRRLSIFAGGWTLEAAETICNLDGDLAGSLEDALESLIDNNLVIQSQEMEEQSRFGMLATIHEYAHERLEESGESDSVHRQHARYYLDFIKTVEPRVRSAERVRWQQVMQMEFGNVRGVLEWISRTGNCLEIGQQIFITFGISWITSGYISEGQQWCMQLISRCDESTPILNRAGLLYIEGWIAWAQGHISSALASVEESLELFHDLEDETTAVKHTHALAMTAYGMLASSCRDLETAKEMFQRSIVLFEETQDQWYQAIALSFLGDIALYENDRERAAALHDQSMKLARRQGDPWCLISSLMSSGQVAVMEGDLRKARSTFLEVEDMLRKTGDHWTLTSDLNDLGHVALMEGDLEQARLYFLEVLPLANSVGNRMVLLISLAGTAALIARRSVALKDSRPQDTPELALAARLCGATAPYIDQPGIFVWPDSKKLYDTAIAQVQSLMEKDFWDRAYAEGQSMPFDRAIALGIDSLKE